VTDLLVLWEWAFDDAFVARLVAAGAAQGVRVDSVGPADVAAALARLRDGAPAPRLVLDRASDVLPEALALAVEAGRRGVLVVNDPARVPAAADKRTMHLALMSVGVEVPWSILLPPGEVTGVEALSALPHVGTPFVIKPAHGGGGDGVVLGASTVEEIERARASRTDDAHLVQERVEPVLLEGRPAWFRVIHCLGENLPCFWTPGTGRYQALDARQLATPWATRLEDTTRAIAAVSGMSLFSTELALAADGRLVAVDYVNDMCDLRPASRHPDGVPDEVLEAVIAHLLDRVSPPRA